MILAFDLIPLVIGISSWRRVSADLRVLAAFFALTTIFDLILLYLAIYKMPNRDVLLIYSWLEFLVFGYLYLCWQSSKRPKSVLSSCFGFLILFFCLGSFLNPEQDFLYYTQIAECTTFIALSLHTLYKFMASDLGAISKDHRFWVSSGILIYFTGHCLFFVSAPFAETFDFWVLLLTVNLIANLFYTGGVLSQRSLKTGRSSSLEPGLSWL